MNKKPAFYREDELVVLLKSNDKAAYEYLYDKYAPALYGIVCKIVKDDCIASDVLQESFVKIWVHIAHYDPDKGTLFTWILNVTHRTAIDKLRADYKFRSNIAWDAVYENDVRTILAFTPLVSTMDLMSIVGTLLPEKRQLIELVYFEGYTHQEASEYLCLPLGTVKSRIRKALQELRRVFDSPAITLDFA